MSSNTKTTATKEEATPALVPKLRFPEFLGGGSWNDVPIASILNIRDERRLPSTDAPLYSLTIENGVTAKTDRYNREFLVRDSGNKKYKLVEPNDIVFNPSNLRWGAINYSQLTHSVVVSPIYEVLSLGDSSANFLEFIACSVMRGEQIRRFIIKGQGTLVERIAVKVEDFLSTNLPVPPTRAEQQKIAECLSSVDDLIAAQARKLDALKTHKKGLMQQLFPREGETQPRLRFPEFQNAGEWEEVRLGRLGELVSGLTYSPDDVRESGLLVLRSSNVQKGEITLDDCVYVDPSVKGANLSQPNDILICVRNGSKALIGKCALIPEGMPLCTHGAFMTVFRAKTPNFVFQLYQSDRYQKQVAGDLGATINSINGGQLLKYVFFVPKPPEQQCIADCLTSLDDLIAGQTQKLEALKTHKKGLMQQLFPSPEVAE
jgi:type I restriction enzyme S subunit